MKLKTLTLRHSRQFGTLFGLIILGFILSILSPFFLTISNLLNVVEQSSINAIIAVGMTFVIITAGIDLSVGSILAFAGVIMASLLHANLPFPLAILTGLLVGTICGTINGLCRSGIYTGTSHIRVRQWVSLARYWKVVQHSHAFDHYGHCLYCGICNLDPNKIWPLHLCHRRK